MKIFGLAWEIMFPENPGTNLFQSNCWRFEYFNYDTIISLGTHNLQIYQNIRIKYGTVSSRKATHFALTNSLHVRVVSFLFLKRSFKSEMILTDLLTFIVVMTTSFARGFGLYMYKQVSFKIFQVVIWSYIKTVFTITSVKMPSDLGTHKLKYAICFSWDTPEKNKVPCFVSSRNQVVNFYVTLPGRKTSISARNRSTYCENRVRNLI